MSNLSFKPPPPAAILDLDGTVADTLDDLTAAVNHALDRWKAPVRANRRPTQSTSRAPAGDGQRTLDRGTIRELVGDGLPALMSRAGGTRDPAAISDLVRRFKQHYDRHCLAHTRLYPGAERFFAHCHQHGVKLAILSNKPHEFTLMICDRLLSRWPMAAILGAHDGLPLKPDPAPALALADAMKRDPAAVLFVGDSVVDVETARAAGMPSVAVTWGFQDRARLRDAHPDHLVDSFEELWDAIAAPPASRGP